MQEMKCPNCGSVFEVDETGYAKIAQQVRDKEFEKELQKRVKSEIMAAKMEQAKGYDQELARLRLDLAERDAQIQALTAKLDGSDAEKKLAVKSAMDDQAQVIQSLKSQLEQADVRQQLAISDAVQAKDKELAKQSMEIAALQSQLDHQATERELGEKSIRQQYELQLRAKDEQIEYYRDFKARQSTKMVGESLEQHCMVAFESLRATAFPRAYFEKDNDVRTGSKGDFIFREFAEDGTELLSIMFEMKNEMDTTATKHKNEDFFRELDKDRKEKGCEYAILVSLLEIDNELYNMGIVDVSHRYEKMYVIRPQFFIPIITILRNAAVRSESYRQELQAMRNRQLDVSRFEENIEAFKHAFGKNYELSSHKFQDAIADIEKTIRMLEKTKADLISSDRNLRLANDKAQALSVKSLTKGAPSVRAMFEDMAQPALGPALDDGE